VHSTEFDTCRLVCDSETDIQLAGVEYLFLSGTVSVHRHSEQGLLFLIAVVIKIHSTPSFRWEVKPKALS
jgi:hypothetical protein